MGCRSRPVTDEIKNKFGDKFHITTERRKEFCFDGTSYNPDLVFRSKLDSSIRAIIEVEQGTRKHVVGGVITADYCMGKIKQSPVMFVLALDKQDRKDYLKRKKLIKSYTKHIKEIVIGNSKEIITALSKLKA